MTASDLFTSATELMKQWMLALERLSPLERAAFLLHDVFGLEFEEVSPTLRRDPSACRQLAARVSLTSQRRSSKASSMGRHEARKPYDLPKEIPCPK